MHICYIDEAGSTGSDLNSVEQPVFAMAGVLVSDEKWRRTERAFTDRVHDAVGGPIPAGSEVHVADLLGPEGRKLFDGWSRERRNA
jgi:hypothetical protein